MIDENEARNEGKRVRPEGKREGGRRLMDSRPGETPEAETLEELQDFLEAFDLDEEEGPDSPEEDVLSWDLPEAEEPEEELPDLPPATEGGRRVRAGEKAQEEEPSKSGLWSRAMDACTDFAGRVLDWTDELSERFDEMVSDPENDSLAARVIRESEDIVEGLEEQQRETDAEIDEEERMRAARGQHKREVPPQPKLVFYTADNPDTPVDLRDLARDCGKQGKQPRRAVSRPEESEASAQEVGITRDALIDQFSAQPEPEKPEQPAQPPRKRSAAPRREAEPAQRRPAAPRREAEQPVREKSVKPPIPKEERQQVLRLTRKLQYWLFVLVLGFFGILGILGPLRADSTEVENRPLTEKPAISMAGLWNGDYFGRLEQWYSDTYPLRDRLAGEYDLLGPLGFGPVTLKQDTATEKPNQEAPEGSAPAGTQSPESGAPVTSPVPETGAPSASPVASE